MRRRKTILWCYRPPLSGQKKVSSSSSLSLLPSPLFCSLLFSLSLLISFSLPSLLNYRGINNFVWGKLARMALTFASIYTYHFSYTHTLSPSLRGEGMGRANRAGWSLCSPMPTQPVCRGSGLLPVSTSAGKSSGLCCYDLIPTESYCQRPSLLQSQE